MANEPLRLEADPQYELNEARQEVDGLKTATAMFVRELKLAQYQGHLLRQALDKARAQNVELEKVAKELGEKARQAEELLAKGVECTCGPAEKGKAKE